MPTQTNQNLIMQMNLSVETQLFLEDLCNILLLSYCMFQLTSKCILDTPKILILCVCVGGGGEEGAWMLPVPPSYTSCYCSTNGRYYTIYAPGRAAHGGQISTAKTRNLSRSTALHAYTHTQKHTHTCTSCQQWKACMLDRLMILLACLPQVKYAVLHQAMNIF